MTKQIEGFKITPEPLEEKPIRVSLFYSPSVLIQDHEWPELITVGEEQKIKVRMHQDGRVLIHGPQGGMFVGNANNPQTYGILSNAVLFVLEKHEMIQYAQEVFNAFPPIELH